jgi:hypothetical protein
VRRFAFAALFVGLDMADLATVCALPQGALHFLGTGKRRRRARRARRHRTAIGIEAFLFLASKSSLLVLFKASQLLLEPVSGE